MRVVIPEKMDGVTGPVLDPEATRFFGTDEARDAMTYGSPEIVIQRLGLQPNRKRADRVLTSRIDREMKPLRFSRRIGKAYRDRYRALAFVEQHRVGGAASVEIHAKSCGCRRRPRRWRPSRQ